MRVPLVFLPGMMCDARLFAPQIDALSGELPVMVAPLTLHDRFEDMASAFLSVAPPRFALAGLSMGGIVAMEILRRAPDRVSQIALMDTNPLPETPQKAAEREPQIVGARAGRLDEIMRDELKPAYLAPGPGRVAVMEVVMAMARDLGPDVFVRQSRALQRRRDQQGTLRKCKVPALVLCGEHDTLCPVKRHRLMADLMPDAALCVVPGGGHLPTLEQPEAVTAALRDWLKRPLVLGSAFQKV
jgi:pimeloyl-ACP methyl ester carboxylesterase